MDLRRIALFLKNTLQTTPEDANTRMYKIAKQKVQNKKEFLTHFFIFIPVMLLLTFISIFVTPSFWWWFLIPLVGWGIALTSHYIHAFGVPEWWYFGKNWEDRELEKEFLKLKFEKEREEYLKNSERLDLRDDKLELEELDNNLDEEDYV